MLSIADSFDVVINCIADLGKEGSPDDKLKDIGFPDAAAVGVVCDKIASSLTSGVKAKGHRIDRASLNSVAPKSTVRNVADRVRENAVPA